MLPPPVMGWNTRDAISDMGPLFALELENLFPKSGVVELRNGSRYHSKSISTGDVKTIAALEVAAGSYLISVGSDAKVYNSTAAGAASSIHGALPAFGTSICNVIQFRDRVFIKPNNNTDDVYHWTGSGNIAASAFTGPGGDDKALGCIGAYKSRIYFGGWFSNSIWYGGVDAITSTLTEFALDSVFTRGNQVIRFVGPVVRAKQAAEDDLLAIISNRGEILIYQGDYPGSSTWGLVGRYSIPEPCGFRAFFYIGSNLHVLTRIGIISVRDLMSGSNDYFPTISNIINDQFLANYTDSVSGYGASDNYRQTGMVYPRGNYLFANCYNGTSTIQFVQNLETKAWCKFSGQNAFCWAMMGERLYFGSTDGRVMKADEGYYDEDPANEGAVLSRTVKMRQAYNYFDQPEVTKQFTGARPIVYQSEGLDLTLDMNTDYEDTTVTNRVQDTADTAYKCYRPLMGLKNVGKAGSLRIDGTVTTKRMSLQATEIFWNDGDII